MASIAASPSELWMNRVNRPRRLVLASSDELIEALLSDSRATLIYLTDEVCILESADRTLVQGLQGDRQGWTRTFEEYYLASTGEDKAQGVLVGAFFDWLADRYNDEIEPSRNLTCYEELYEVARRLRGAAGTKVVLDLGCGPGTILRSRVARVAQVLVGYDISEIAARAAASDGMSIMPRDEFLAGPRRQPLGAEIQLQGQRRAFVRWRILVSAFSQTGQVDEKHDDSGKQ